MGDDGSERIASAAALAASEARFRTLVETAPALIFAIDSAGRNSFVNERYQRYTGLSFDELCGDGWQEVIHPDDRAAAIAESVDSQKRPRPLERRLRIRRHDGVWHWFLSRTEPVVGAGGDTPFAWLGISIDIDEQVHTEQRERLLAQEVDHRAKNLLAVVQSIVELTSADDGAAFKDAVDGRLQALARSHTLLAAGRWDGVELQALVAEELAAFEGRVAGSLTISGPVLCLKPAMAQSFGLILHELVTNAAKHGSLSVQGGRLDVSWSCDGDQGEHRVLKLLWREAGGPPARRPKTSGFGTTLIRTTVESQLKGAMATTWSTKGLTCEIIVPADHILSARIHGRRMAHQPKDVAASPRLQGHAILVLEDEPLIAMQIDRALTQAGGTVIGPVFTLSDAVDRIVSGKPSAAILDVNLGGSRSFSIADILLEKKIPFIFCTGYAGVDDLPERFATATVVTKPFSKDSLIRAVASAIVT